MYADLFIWKANYKDGTCIFECDGSGEHTFRDIDQSKLVSLEVFRHDYLTEPILRIPLPESVDLILFKEEDTFFYGYKRVIGDRCYKNLVSVSGSNKSVVLLNEANHE
jgi:hypothetical protein